MDVLVISEPITLQIEEFRDWFNKEARAASEPLLERGQKLVDKIRDRLNIARDASQKLVEEGVKEQESGKALRKAKATEKLSRYFLKQIDNVGFPTEMSFSELERLHKDLVEMFSSISKERNLWFPRISPLFIIARTRVDFAFSRVGSSISELDAFLKSDYSSGRTIENTLTEFGELVVLQDKLMRNNQQIENIEGRRLHLQEKLEAAEQDLQSTKESGELGSLTESKLELAQMRKQVKYALRHLQKPFLKLANLVRNQKYSLPPGEMEKLAQYLNDSFVAFATDDPDYPKLRSILTIVARAIVEGQLRLKKSRLRKAQVDIDSILKKKTLDLLHKDCVRVFLTDKKLMTDYKTTAVQTKLSQLKTELSEVQKKEKAAAIRLNTLKKRNIRLRERVEELGKSIEEHASDVLEKQVKLRLQ